MNSKIPVSFEDTSIAFRSKSKQELRKAFLLFATMNNNFLITAGTSMIKLGFLLGMPIKSLIKHTLFNQFCGGENIGESEKVITSLAKFNIGTVLDYSVEGEDSENDFEKTTDEILRTIQRARDDKNIPFTVFKVTGIASAELLEKIQKKEQLDEEEDHSYIKVKYRIDKLCKAAYESRVRIFIDAEESWIQDPIDEIAYEMMNKYNRETAIVFNTFQLYRWDVLENLMQAHRRALEGSFILGAKLVRGAYMEKERERAAEVNYVSPIQEDKKATDKDYDKALVFCVENIDKISICAGTHNEKSTHVLLSLMNKHNMLPNDTRIYFAQLYGMGDHISYNLANAGYNVAKYVPYGPVESVMPYLFRRANENTSIAGQSSREFSLVKKELKRRKRSK